MAIIVWVNVRYDLSDLISIDSLHLLETIRFQLGISLSQNGHCYLNECARTRTPLTLKYPNNWTICVRCYSSFFSSCGFFTLNFTKMKRMCWRRHGALSTVWLIERSQLISYCHHVRRDYFFCGLFFFTEREQTHVFWIIK